MRLSARNQLPATVAEIAEGSEVVAVVKASDVLLGVR